MRVYLVGGAVRDKILGEPVSDKDWVVVGATDNDLLNLGFKQVGKGFPVFLNPNSREEYALARIEKKKGKGHSGFYCFFSRKVTLLEDLSRRDLTINAIATDARGKIIDPFNGVLDIHNRILRHISSSFTEDPLRIFRVARFFSKFFLKKFVIARETKALMKKMAIKSEISSISKERIWEETKKAFCGSSPERYFQVLYECKTLEIFFPEMDHIFNLSFKDSKKIINHSSISRVLSTLRVISKLTNKIEIKISALCIDLLKIKSKKVQCEIHKKKDLCKNIENICNRISTPIKIKKEIKLIILHYQKVHKIHYLSSKKILDIFEKIDGWRKPNRIEKIALIAKADITNKLNNDYYPQGEFFVKAFEKLKKVSIRKIIKEEKIGEKIKERIKSKKIKKLNEWIKNQKIIVISD
ncbi:hypothetical protein AOQ88_02240 [Candidatus Riesia sp. GBBU]|nr:hypothetical protein AOQ88_02210 [Candidatus Riesia sp. GBBU]ARC55042.1 hypothetical protein AOQ88_02240 [Candidatus Riesia sp. GBBU]